jgi:Capsule assembly protein Wzi/PAP2 superfamily
MRANILFNCFLIAASQTSCAICIAQTLDPHASELSSPGEIAEGGTKAETANSNRESKDLEQPTGGDSNAIGASLLKNLMSDQKAIWTSPTHLRWADGTWLFPLAAATAGFFATDRAVPPALPSDPNKLNRYVKVSNYGLYSEIGAGGGLYIWGKLSHNDHQRETGFLAGEAAIDSLAVDTALKYSFGRDRPYQEQGLGNFFQRGSSFPSDHSAIAWSIASVIAHEYPGPLTQVAVYGLATAVSASRVLGKQHFPSDVVVGGVIGWLIGRQVYRAHHDVELGGGGWDSLPGTEDSEDRRDRHNIGSTFVPSDSWVYAAFDRLAALQYVNTAILGLRPWTRMECARLTEEAEGALPEGHALDEEMAQLQSRLAQEFAFEISLLSGGRNFSANLESVYARAVSISGPPLTDSYHFGQTISYDFGRPFERGTNGQAGGSFSATAGPLALFVRTEYQHAPSAPAPSNAIVNFIATGDGVPVSKVPAGPINAINRLQLLDSYVSVNLSNWQIALGTQSLSWAPSTDSLMWSDNIQPVNMVRLVNPEPFALPGFLRHLGPVRIDQFFGRLGGHSYFPRPFVFGQKMNFKPFSFLELGFSRRVMLGGTGSTTPLTGGNFIRAFLGQATGGTASVPGSVPGDNDTGMDWTFYVPKVRNYIVLYGDAYSEDDILPIERPARNPWHPGIYITRIPGIPNLDFHIEGVSTEAPGAIGGTNLGKYIYWNFQNQDGNTNYGNLIGNTVGRDGRTIQSWLRYWISPRDTVQLTYKHNSVSPDFIPGGGAWQDYALNYETYLRSGFYVKAQFQYENISRYPILFKDSQKNFTAIVEVGFSPGEKGSTKGK